MRYFLILMIFITQIFAFNIKDNGAMKSIKYNYNDGIYTTLDGLIFKDNSNILVEFYKQTPALIKEFEEQYDLELQEVLVIGYYVYKLKNGNILEALSSISNHSNVKTVKPNWAQKVELY